MGRETLCKSVLLQPALPSNVTWIEQGGAPFLRSCEHALILVIAKLFLQVPAICFSKANFSLMLSAGTKTLLIHVGLRVKLCPYYLLLISRLSSDKFLMIKNVINISFIESGEAFIYFWSKWDYVWVFCHLHYACAKPQKLSGACVESEEM
jgi:hypothetical protein